MPTVIPKKILARQHEITADFLREIDRHLSDIVAGRATEMFEVRDLAGLLCIHPTHLSNTIKLSTGRPPCYFFEARIMDVARQLLRDPTRTVANIAANLTYTTLLISPNSSSASRAARPSNTASRCGPLSGPCSRKLSPFKLNYSP